MFFLIKLNFNNFFFSFSFRKCYNFSTGIDWSLVTRTKERKTGKKQSSKLSIIFFSSQLFSLFKKIFKNFLCQKKQQNFSFFFSFHLLDQPRNCTHSLFFFFYLYFFKNKYCFKMQCMGEESRKKKKKFLENLSP